MVQWTPEKDQLLFKSTLAFHKLSLSKDFLQYLADQVGEGCTPKAVSNHLAKYVGKLSDKPTGSAVSIPKTPATSRKAIGIPKSVPRSRGKPTPKSNLKKQVNASGTDSDDETTPPSPSIGRKRSRPTEKAKSYAESEADSGESDEYSPKKRVKDEPVEDGFDSVLGSVFDNQDTDETAV